MASFNFNIIFHDHDKDEVLCFKHAVIAVINGHDVTPEIDEFGQDGNDMREWCCKECSRPKPEEPSDAEGLSSFFTTEEIQEIIHHTRQKYKKT